MGEENKTTNESLKEFSVSLSDALALHPSNYPSLILVEKLLEGDNYGLRPHRGLHPSFMARENPCGLHPFDHPSLVLIEKLLEGDKYGMRPHRGLQPSLRLAKTPAAFNHLCGLRKPLQPSTIFVACENPCSFQPSPFSS